MKQKCFVILQIITLVLLIICLLKISSISNKVEQMQNNLSNRISNVENELNNTSYQIKSTLEEEVCFLSVEDWSYGNFDQTSKCVELICRIAPKEYTPETTAKVLFENEEYPLANDDGVFTGSIPISVFEESHIELVCFTTGDTVRTEKLDWYVCPRQEFLTTVYAHFYGSYSHVINKDYSTFTYDGEIFLDIEYKNNSEKVKEIRLVECIDDKEIKCTELADYISDSTRVCEWDNSVDIPYGSTYKAYVEVVDEYGFYHRSLIAVEEISDNGERVEDLNWWEGAEADIYDADGTPLCVFDEL